MVRHGHRFQGHQGIYDDAPLAIRIPRFSEKRFLG
jgi:hypothetical protein